MGSRKEIIKKALGISEYPWSSDDDDDEMNNQETNTQETQTPTTATSSQQRNTNDSRNNSTTYRDTNRPAWSRTGTNTYFRTGVSSPYVRDTVPVRQRLRATVSEVRDPRQLLEITRLNVPYNIERAHNSLAQPRPPSLNRDRPVQLQEYLDPLRSPTNIQRIVAFKKLTRGFYRDRNRASLSGSRSNSSVIRSPIFATTSTSEPTISMNYRIGPDARNNSNINNSSLFNYTFAAENNDPIPSSSGLQQPVNDFFEINNNNIGEVGLAVPNNDVRMSDEEGERPSAEQPTRNEPTQQEYVEGRNPSLDMIPAEEVVIETPNETDINGNENVLTSQEGNEELHMDTSNNASTAEAQASEEQRNLDADQQDGDLCTVKEFNQGLLRLLECPVCLDWMEPPISQCRRGHLVCGRCRSRLNACPVCRSMFSSVRNRAMEGVAEMLRYPCRHGCGREVKLRRRKGHESSCGARKYLCPASSCTDRVPMPYSALAGHFQNKHFSMLKVGLKHKISIKVNAEFHDNWFIKAFNEFFHLRIDVDFPSWGIIVYVAYIGPKCKANNYIYEVSVDGQHNARKVVYSRTTHSDLESSALNLSRQDCFHITLDQALNFLRIKNKNYESEKFLDFQVSVSESDLVYTEGHNSDS